MVRKSSVAAIFGLALASILAGRAAEGGSAPRPFYFTTSFSATSNAARNGPTAIAAASPGVYTLDPPAGTGSALSITLTPLNLSTAPGVTGPNTGFAEFPYAQIALSFSGAAVRVTSPISVDFGFTTSVVVGKGSAAETGPTTQADLPFRGTFTLTQDASNLSSFVLTQMQSTLTGASPVNLNVGLTKQQYNAPFTGAYRYFALVSEDENLDVNGSSATRLIAGTSANPSARTVGILNGYIGLGQTVDTPDDEQAYNAAVQGFATILDDPISTPEPGTLAAALLGLAALGLRSARRRSA